MNAVLRKIVGDLRRRRLQAAVIFVIVFLASGTAAVGLNLLAGMNDPYQTAFEQQRGAHLAVIYLASKVTTQQLAATPQLIGATAAAGPWPSIGGRFERGHVKLANLNLFGRSDPGGPVNVLRLTSGRWLQGPGEIVLTRSLAELQGISIGDSLTAISTAARASFRVVGEVIDVDESSADFGTQSAWVLPSEVPGLLSEGDHLSYTMAYRFPTTPSADQLRQITSTLESAFPAGAIVYALPFTLIKTAFTIVNQVILIFLLAFSVFALAAAAAIVGNAIAGVVIASYRDIGIMKAVGFTPGQVLQVFIGQLAIPALFGCVIGIPLGTLSSQVLLAQTSHALGLPPQVGLAPFMALIALCGCLFIVILAAAIPALRAGLLSPARAISLGALPNPPASGWLTRLLRAAHLPRPVSLGGSDAFARPLRSGFTVMAIVIAVATLTFALGLNRTIQRFTDQLFMRNAYQVQVTRTGGYSDDRVMATLGSQSETRSIIGLTCTSIAIPGVSDPLVCATRGDATGLGIQVRQGRWFNGIGEAVAPHPFLTQAHLKVGDTLSFTLQGQPIQVRIVGETLDFENLGHAVRLDWSTWQEAFPGAQPLSYLISLRPGSSPQAFANRVQATEPDFLNVQVHQTAPFSALSLINGVLAFLVVVLILIAIAGAFNTILLNSRERVRDTAILRSLGMSPRQVLAMVIASAGIMGLLGGVVGVPVGVVLFQALTGAMANLIGFDIAFPAAHAFALPMLLAFAGVGVLLAIVGALVPARWASRTSIVEVLHTE